MNDNDTKNKKSELEKIPIFYEHTEDKRVIVNKKSQLVKQPKLTTANRR